MNDRFKFRVWNQKHNFYCNQLAEMCINYNGYCFDNGVSADYFEHDGFVIEQCTGLKDKNGNLIYEGDRIFDGDYFWQVKWDNYNAQWILSDPEGYETLTEPDAKHLEIIGNIHEQKD